MFKFKEGDIVKIISDLASYSHLKDKNAKVLSTRVIVHRTPRRLVKIVYDDGLEIEVSEFLLCSVRLEA